MPATLADKLALPFTISMVLGKTLLSAATGPFRGQEAALVYSDHVMHTLIRSALLHLLVE